MLSLERVSPLTLKNPGGYNRATSRKNSVVKTLGSIKERFYWVHYWHDVQEWCHRFVCGPLRPLGQYNVGSPTEHIAIDVLGPLPETEAGNRSWLWANYIKGHASVSDHCQRLWQFQSSAKKLRLWPSCSPGKWSGMHLGVPDQERNFESTLVADPWNEILYNVLLAWNPLQCTIGIWRLMLVSLWACSHYYYV